MAEINLKQLTSGGPSDIDVNFNGTLEGQANAQIPLNVNLTDGVSDITPTSVVLTGNDLDIIVEPSGVLFKTIEPSQYTSYRTGDEGWQVQNGVYDYTPPTNPKAVAELDYSSPNFFNVLKDPLTVGGVTSTTRFVDVNGIQAFSATGNANLVVIDKLTGRMYTKTKTTAASESWNSVIDNALAYSVVINGVTYDDWAVITLPEIWNVFHNYAGINPNTDTLTSVVLFENSANQWTATTSPSSTILSVYYDFATRILGRIDKPTPYGFFNAIRVRNARNLITAP
jgi:hypothetical protein